MEPGKETKGKLMMEMKTQRAIGTDKEEERDRLSELPDCVLLHIMKFLILVFCQNDGRIFGNDSLISLSSR